MIEIKAPEFPESIADGEIAVWHVQVGEQVSRDQVLVDIETDKVVLEVVAPVDGHLSEILKQAGETVLAEEVMGHFVAGEAAVVEAKSSPAEPAALAVTAAPEADAIVSPAAKKMAAEHKVDVTQISGTGKGGRVTKEDVLMAVANVTQAAGAVGQPTVPVAANEATGASDRIERRVPMTRLRASVARRLLEAQQTAAMLTTFNEVNMSSLMKLRADYKDAFEAAHEVRLGFMGVFVQAAIQALREFPAVNAEIDGTDIIYKNYYNIGVAVGTPQGLVVPVIKDAGEMSLADTERAISDFGLRARDGKIAPDDMAGGTFTISNGGVYGSMMSTPILNPPQSGILGMHKIEKRAVVIDDQIVIRPMMYLALSYDHRIIDGREAVSFLARIKELVEDPRRLLMGV